MFPRLMHDHVCCLNCRTKLSQLHGLTGSAWLYCIVMYCVVFYPYQARLLRHVIWHDSRWLINWISGSSSHSGITQVKVSLTTRDALLLYIRISYWAVDGSIGRKTARVNISQLSLSNYRLSCYSGRQQQAETQRYWRPTHIPQNDLSPSP